MKKFLFTIFFIVTILHIQAQNITVTIRAFIQGYYRPSLGRMVAVVDSVNYPDLCDTIILNLLDSSPPHAVLYSNKSTLATNGSGSFQLFNVQSGSYYFIELKHRSALKVNSLTPVLFNSPAIFYDFTLLPKTFCADSDTSNGIALILNGDVTGDGFISTGDVVIIDNANLTGVTGYVTEDLNGDGIVNTTDVAICDSNNMMGVHGCLNIGINELQENEKDLSVFPNPSSGIYFLKLHDQTDKIISIVIRDILGHEIVSIKNGSSTIDIGNHSPGIYLIQASTHRNKVFNTKILKE